jgi:hypothetical protein
VAQVSSPVRSRGGAVLSLVPKLRLGNPSGRKALLCQPYSDHKIITEAPKQSLGHKSVPKRELGNEIGKCCLKLYREKVLVNVEQAPSPALEKNSRGRLFHISSISGMAKNGHESLACAIPGIETKRWLKPGLQKNGALRPPINFDP